MSTRGHMAILLATLTIATLLAISWLYNPTMLRTAPAIQVDTIMKTFVEDDRNRSSSRGSDGFLWQYVAGNTDSYPVITAAGPSQAPNASTKDWKTILFWNSWFGQPWNYRFGTTNATELKEEGCPSWKCNFTYDRRYAGNADAIVIHAGWASTKHLPRVGRPEYQRWVWVEVEAPGPPSNTRNDGPKSRYVSTLFNWTMTYHSQSDIAAFYGYFLSLNASVRPLRPNLMSNHNKAMKQYTAALGRGDTLETVMGPVWRSFVSRPKLVAWMSSHCHTHTKREEYVAELAKYIPVDKYGKCGDKQCFPVGVLNDLCWKNVLSRNYSFFLSMENSFCDDYITEKLYNPLVHNLVPIVYGGSDYERFLPPHSYINARHYHPRELARLLTRLQQDPVAYGRYHLWRGYFRAMIRGTMCELCHRLHVEASAPPSHHTDIASWRTRSGRCRSIDRGMFNSTLGSGSWRTIITTHYDPFINTSLLL